MGCASSVAAVPRQLGGSDSEGQSTLLPRCSLNEVCSLCTRFSRKLLLKRTTTECVQTSLKHDKSQLLGLELAWTQPLLVAVRVLLDAATQFPLESLQQLSAAGCAASSALGLHGQEHKPSRPCRRLPSLKDSRSHDHHVIVAASSACVASSLAACLTRHFQANGSYAAAEPSDVPGTPNIGLPLHCYLYLLPYESDGDCCAEAPATPPGIRAGRQRRAEANNEPPRPPPALLGRLPPLRGLTSCKQLLLCIDQTGQPIGSRACVQLVWQAVEAHGPLCLRLLVAAERVSSSGLAAAWLRLEQILRSDAQSRREEALRAAAAAAATDGEVTGGGPTAMLSGGSVRSSRAPTTVRSRRSSDASCRSEQQRRSKRTSDSDPLRATRTSSASASFALGALLNAFRPELAREPLALSLSAAGLGSYAEPLKVRRGGSDHDIAVAASVGSCISIAGTLLSVPGDVAASGILGGPCAWLLEAARRRVELAASTAGSYHESSSGSLSVWGKPEPATGPVQAAMPCGLACPGDGSGQEAMVLIQAGCALVPLDQVLMVEAPNTPDKPPSASCGGGRGLPEAGALDRPSFASCGGGQHEAGVSSKLPLVQDPGQHMKLPSIAKLSSGGSGKGRPESPAAASTKLPSLASSPSTGSRPHPAVVVAPHQVMQGAAAGPTSSPVPPVWPSGAQNASLSRRSPRASWQTSRRSGGGLQVATSSHQPAVLTASSAAAAAAASVPLAAPDEAASQPAAPLSPMAFFKQVKATPAAGRGSRQSGPTGGGDSGGSGPSYSGAADAGLVGGFELRNRFGRSSLSKSTSTAAVAAAPAPVLLSRTEVLEGEAAELDLCGQLLQLGDQLAAAKRAFLLALRMHADCGLEGKCGVLAQGSLEAAAACCDSLGQHQEALELRQRAWRVLSVERGEGDRAALAAIIAVGRSQAALGDASAAAAVLRRASALLDEHVGCDAADARVCLSMLATVLRQAGDTTGALDVLRDLHRRIVTLSGAGSAESLSALHGVAACLLELGRVDEAEACWQAALELVSSGGMEDRHPQAMTVLQSLAGCRYGAGKVAEALPLYERLSTARLQAYGQDHPDAQDAEQLLRAVRAQLELTAAV